MRRNLAFGAYLLAVHLALLAALVNGDLVERTAAKVGLTERDLPEITWLRKAQDRLDDSVPAGATIFLGDSHMQFLPASAVAPLAVNYGIGRQRSDQLLESMNVYGAMSRARAVVVMIGLNDIAQGREEGIEDRYRAILAKVPPNIPVFWNAITPVADNGLAQRVHAVNAVARSICEKDRRCTFVDTWAALAPGGVPIQGTLTDDGVHLTPKAYAAWSKTLRSVLGHDQAIP